MDIQRIINVLKKGEGIRIEFKESKTKLPSNLFESICAMLNRDGGDIILGADDIGNITGINSENLNPIIANLVNLSNNPEKLDPPFILFPKDYQIDNQFIVHINIPSSSQIHKTAGLIYDRSNDGDFIVTESQQIADLHNHKQNYYTEGIIYPEVAFSDFNPDLFIKARKLIRSRNSEHLWLSITDEQLLMKAGLYRNDYQSGKEGFTLAAILLFGKDDLIQQIIPQYKIDAILRRTDTLRYDDRLYIKTNLIDAYDELMGFIIKHLPDKFFIEGDQRKSLRLLIFREIIANLLVHREYTNALPATLLINNNQVSTVNANIPNGYGELSINDFSPFLKNPLIARFFMQLGRVDELGSGLLNVNRYIKNYSGNVDVHFIEGITFRTIIPLVEGAPEGATEGAAEGAINIIIDNAFDNINADLKDRLIQLLKVIEINGGKRVPELSEITQFTNKSLERYIKRLRDAKLIEYKGKATRSGGYFLTKSIKRKLSK